MFGFILIMCIPILDVFGDIPQVELPWIIFVRVVFPCQFARIYHWNLIFYLRIWYQPEYLSSKSFPYSSHTIIIHHPHFPEPLQAYLICKYCLQIQMLSTTSAFQWNRTMKSFPPTQVRYFVPSLSPPIPSATRIVFYQGNPFFHPRAVICMAKIMPGNSIQMILSVNNCRKINWVVANSLIFRCLVIKWEILFHEMLTVLSINRKLRVPWKDRPTDLAVPDGLRKICMPLFSWWKLALPSNLPLRSATCQ